MELRVPLITRPEFHEHLLSKELEVSLKNREMYLEVPRGYNQCAEHALASSLEHLVGYVVSIYKNGDGLEAIVKLMKNHEHRVLERGLTFNGPIHVVGWWNETEVMAKHFCYNSYTPTEECK